MPVKHWLIKMYTVAQLITKAFYESGIVSKQFETVTAEEISTGLDYLNEVIGKKRIDNATIPYFTSYELTLFQGQEKYFIPDLIEMDTMVFYLNQIRYAMVNQKRRMFFGTARAENIETLPSNFHIERTLGGSNVYLYFLPNQNYPAIIWGQFALQSVSLEQDLSTMFDLYYSTYLRYDLVRSLCAAYNKDVPLNIDKEFLEYDRSIRKRSAVIDLQNVCVSTVSRPNSFNYAQANLGKGWTT